MEYSERFIKIFEDESFASVYEWTDEPDTVYEEHEHQDRVSFYITDGSIDMVVDKKNISLKSGDRYDIPPKTPHSAVVGPKGCHFVVAEMIEGDS